MTRVLITMSQEARENLATKVYRVHMESQENQQKMEKKESRVLMDDREGWVRRVLLDYSQVHQDSQVSQDLLVKRESKGRRVILD